MEMVDMHNGTYLTATIVLCSIFLGLRIIAFYIMSLRIKRRLGESVLCFQ